MQDRTIRSWRLRRSAVPLLLVLLVSSPASAKSNLGHAASEAGLGMAAGVLSAAYLPLKAAIASAGFLMGGAAWLVTGADPEPAHSILNRTAGGDWLVTQQHLQGRQDFAILGPSTRASVASRPPPEPHAKR